MKGDQRKYLSRAFDKSVESQREDAAREANAFLSREQWFEKIVCLEWRLVPTPFDLWRFEITGVEK